MGKGNLKSRTARAGILRLPSFVLRTEEAEGACSVHVTARTYPVREQEHSVGTTAGRSGWVCVSLSASDTEILYLGAVRMDE